MGIKFFTKNLNTRLYKRAIFRMLHEMYPRRMDYIFYWRHWNWEVHPSTEAHSDPHFNGQDGVGGIVGMGTVTLYLEDKRTNMIYDFFRRVFRQNFTVIGIEAAHSVLLDSGRKHKVPLRHADTSGHKAGTMLPFFVAEVHDRHAEGRFKLLKPFSYFDMKTMTYVRVKNVKVVDIDDLL